MDLGDVSDRGLVLLGCGKMGSAMLAGWLDGKLAPGDVHVIDPKPSDWLQGSGVHINEALPDNPAILILAVKPQMMGEALGQVTRFGGGGTLIISIAAGTSIKTIEDAFGAGTPVLRAMPNTPAAIGQGITALVGNDLADEDHITLAEALLSAVGQTVRLDSEEEMHGVTAVSGSGPAYVFHLIEAMADAGAAEGLDRDLALRLAQATVLGAATLAERSGEKPSTLRENVTSPGGTTAAALGVLMDEEAGFPALLRRAIRAAADRSRELSQ